MFLNLLYCDFGNDSIQMFPTSLSGCVFWNFTDTDFMFELIGTIAIHFESSVIKSNRL